MAALLHILNNDWITAHLAVKITKEGIEHFVFDKMRRFQEQCLSELVQYGHAICSKCRIEDILPCPTRNLCTVRGRVCNVHGTRNRRRPCPLNMCELFCNKITAAHQFIAPSFTNTDATQWCSNPWEIAKCFMPPDKNKDVTCPSKTDFIGLISVLINYRGGYDKDDDDIFKQCRDIDRMIKKSHTLEMKHDDLQRIFSVLRSLLTLQYFVSDTKAQYALNRLDELESDPFRFMEPRPSGREEYYENSGTAIQSMETNQHIGVCQICKQAGKFVYCVKCQRSYHASCLKSEPKEIDVYNWICQTCYLHVKWREDIEDIERFRIVMKQKQSKVKLPKEILEMDSRSIDIYKEALKEGVYHAHHIRVMVVGQYEVGKTTLTKRLFGDEVDIDKRESTYGIDVHVGRCRVSMKDGSWDVRGKQTDKANTIKDIERSALFKRLASSVLRASSEEASDQTYRKECDDASSSTVIYERVEMQNVAEGPMEKKARIYQENTTGRTDTTKKDPCIREMKHLKEFIEHVQKDIGEDNEHNCDLSLWDFAGQNEFYDTHQAFLSRRAIYLLVVDMSTNIEDISEDSWVLDCQGERKCSTSDFVDFWLNSIHEHCSPSDDNGPPVILVGTFADKTKENVSVENAFVPLLTSIADKVTSCHLTEENFLIDNTIEDKRIESLRRYIFEVATEQEYWGEPVPVKWITLEEILIGLKNENVKILPKTELKELNATLPVPIDTDDELETFLNFHHEIGNILYYRKGVLQEYILLDPQWLINAFKSLITARKFCIKLKDVQKYWKEFDKTAILKPYLIEKIWSREENKDFLTHKEVLLNYMEVLGYITKPRTPVEETNSSANLEQFAEYYFVPCKLKQPAPKEVTDSTESRHCKSTSKLCFTTSEDNDQRFIPKTAFNRFFASCLNTWPLSIQKRKSMIFCGGAVFCLEDNHFLYIFMYEHVIQMWISRISIDGQSPRHSICLKTKDCVTSMLEENVKINSQFVLFVKCPEASLNYDDTMMLLERDNNTPHEPTVCFCQDKEHVIVFEDLIKYWSNENTVLQIKLGSEFNFERIPTEKEFSHIAKEVGFEFKQLGFELLFSQAEIDQIRMDNEIAVDKTTALLLKWKARAAERATFGELGAAMHRVGIDVAKAFKRF